MKVQESAAERSKRIRETYGATTEFNSNPYRVEVQGCLMSTAWFTHRWYFPTEQDAIAYCKKETKNDTARVIKEEYVAEENTIYPTLVYMKEGKS